MVHLLVQVGGVAAKAGRLLGGRFAAETEISAGADDGQGVAQHLSFAGEIRAGTTIAGTELDLGCHGSRISQLEEHRLL